MKKFAWHFLLTLIATIALLVAPVTQVAYAAELTDAPVMVLSAKTSGKTVTVDAVLKQNSGISGLTVEIEYDTSAMKLTNVERGNTLSSLEYITTNPNTEAGFSIIPFRINWSGDENDYSTGTILKMTFLLSEDVANGDYTIALRQKGLTYLDGGVVRSKNILIDNTKIRISGDVPQVIEGGNTIEQTDETEPHEPNILLIGVLSGVGSVAVIAIVALIMQKAKSKKTKEKNGAKKKAVQKNQRTADTEAQKKSSPKVNQTKKD